MMNATTFPAEHLIRSLFRLIDTLDRPLRRHQLEIRLADGSHMSLSTQGRQMALVGKGYDVVLDHQAGKLWSKYAVDGDQMSYRGVPRLLITHHIHNHGGISEYYQLKPKPSLDSGLR